MCSKGLKENQFILWKSEPYKGKTFVVLVQKNGKHVTNYIPMLAKQPARPLGFGFKSSALNITT